MNAINGTFGSLSSASLMVNNNRVILSVFTYNYIDQHRYQGIGEKGRKLSIAPYFINRSLQ